MERPKKTDRPDEPNRRLVLGALGVAAAGAAIGAYFRDKNVKEPDVLGEKLPNEPEKPRPPIGEMPPQKIRGMETLLEEQLKQGDTVTFGKSEQSFLNVAWHNRIRTRDYINRLAGANMRIRSAIGESSQETYLEHLTKIFQEEGVPPALCYISFTESDFKLADENGEPVRSPVGAVGPFQFMEETAKSYGLKIERNKDTKKIIKDDRANALLSGRAAARCLKDLAKTFAKKKVPNDEAWQFAILSYNGGFAQKYRNKTAEPSMAGFREYMTAKMRERLEEAELDRKWKVWPRETLESISSKCGISERALKEANPKVDWSKLVAHRTEITIPGLKNAPMYVEMEKGDTLISLLRELGTTENELKHANPKIQWNLLPSGLEIAVPKRSAAFADFVRQRKLLELRGYIENLDYLPKTLAIIKAATSYDLSPRIPLPTPRPRIDRAE